MTETADWRSAVLAEVEREILRAIPCLVTEPIDYNFGFTAYWPQTREGIVFTLRGKVSGEKFRACEPVAVAIQSLMERAPIEGRA